MDALIPQCGQITAGGLLRIEYLPLPFVNQAQSTWLASEAHVWAGVIESSRNWYKLDCLPSDRPYTDKYVPDEQGGHFERDIKLSRRAITATDLATLIQMQQYRYLVRIKDRTGTTYMLNDVNTPMSLTIDYAQGASAGQNPRTSFTFSCKIPQQAYYVQAN